MPNPSGSNSYRRQLDNLIANATLMAATGASGMHIVEMIRATLKDLPDGPSWRKAEDKPEHLPGEYHSRPVLLLMKANRWADNDWGRIKIGHVSIGHWRPAGGNGNFDDDVEGWMELPSATNDEHKEKA